MKFEVRLITPAFWIWKWGKEVKFCAASNARKWAFLKYVIDTLFARAELLRGRQQKQKHCEFAPLYFNLWEVDWNVYVYSILLNICYDIFVWKAQFIIYFVYFYSSHKNVYPNEHSKTAVPWTQRKLNFGISALSRKLNIAVIFRIHGETLLCMWQRCRIMPHTFI
jgi:hypothetical protein